jgi:hypothetical protein
MASSDKLHSVALVRTDVRSVRRLLVTANVVPTSPILVSLMMEALNRFLEESHGVTSHKTPFFNLGI